MKFKLEKPYSLIGVLILLIIILAAAGILFYNYQFKGEIVAQEDLYIKTIIIILLLLFSVSALLIIVSWRINKLKFYKKEYESEKEKNVLLKHYDYLSKYANDIIILLDDKGIIRQANEKALKIYGYTQEEFYGQSGKILRPAELQNEYDEIIRQIYREEGTVYETIHQKKNGERFFVEISVRPFCIEESTYLQSIIRDITVRKNAEEALLKSEAHLRTLLHTIPDLVWLKDVNGVFLACNTIFEHLLGAKEADIIGKNDYDFVNRELADFFRERDRKAIEAGMPIRNEEWVTFGGDGHRALLETTKTPMYDAKGTLIGVLGIGHDITKRKSEEKELIDAKEKAEELNRLKTNFLANMSHEVRTPLIGILGYSEMILDENYDTELKEKVGVIYKSGKKLNETLDTILDITKIEAEKVDLIFEKFNLGELINETVMLYKVLADEKGVELKYSPGTNGLMVELDKRFLTKILNNLLSNAIKFTYEGEVTVSTYCNDRKVKIEVEDTGIGIPLDKLNIVFEPFRQVSEGYNRQFEGTGLGLTITKMLVERMDGQIFLKSRQGTGSKFTIEFPIYLNQ
jgi:PAS domain S-box-containing protein